MKSYLRYTCLSKQAIEVKSQIAGIPAQRGSQGVGALREALECVFPGNARREVEALECVFPGNARREVAPRGILKRTL